MYAHAIVPGRIWEGDKTMAIRTLREKFQNELFEVYDAEHHLLTALEEMHAAAADPHLQTMIATHREQTRGHVLNLEQVFRLMGLPAQRMTDDGAKGILSEGQKLIRDTRGSPEVCDTAILDVAAKAEHYEISAYRSLIANALSLGQSEVANLLHLNLEQEEQAARMIEQAQPAMIRKALEAPAGLDSAYNETTRV
jgi:ferritin-like metal-binding protein YciE